MTSKKTATVVDSSCTCHQGYHVLVDSNRLTISDSATDWPDTVGLHYYWGTTLLYSICPVQSSCTNLQSHLHSRATCCDNRLQRIVLLLPLLLSAACASMLKRCGTFVKQFRDGQKGVQNSQNLRCRPTQGYLACFYIAALMHSSGPQ